MIAVAGKLLPLLAAGGAGSGGAASAVVRGGRLLYAGSATFIAVAWYSSWRNKKGVTDFTSWPIPGLEKSGDIGAPSKPDPDVTSYNNPIIGTTDGISANDSLGALPGAVSTQNLGPTPANTGSHRTTLYTLATVAKQQFGLNVGEYPPFGPVHNVHAAGSYHYKGQAFDASGPEARMHAFAQYVQSNFGRSITELIHNPGFSIKNGSVVAPSFWGASTWAGHRDHVHVAIAGR